MSREEGRAAGAAREQSRFRRYAPPILFGSGLLLLFIHSFAPDRINVSYFTILLLLFLAFLPFVADVRKLVVTPDRGIRIVKTTGELRERVESSKESAIRKLRGRIAELEREEQRQAVESEISSRLDQVRSEIDRIARTEGTDAAFMELARRLEAELRDVLRKEGLAGVESTGFDEMIRLAREHEALDRNLIVNLEDIVPLRDQVAGGKEVDPDEAGQMLELGLDLLETILYEVHASDITEHAIRNAIHQDPALVEEGFRPVETDVATDYGEIDLLGEDRAGNDVIVEIKSHEVDATHVRRLRDLVDGRRRDAGDGVRGVLISPSVKRDARELEGETVTVRELDLRTLCDHEVELQELW